MNALGRLLRLATPLCLVVGLAAAAGPGAGDYVRELNADSLDQPTLDAEGFGEKKTLKREDDGLRVTLDAGAEETGWKPPQQLRFGGDFSVSAEIEIKAMPKPAMPDGVAVGLAIAFGSIDQPDATFLREVETDGAAVYRALDKAAGGGDPAQRMQIMMMQQRVMIVNGMGVVMPGVAPDAAKHAPPPRKTFPAAGDSFRMELKREGRILRFLVADAKTDEPRYLGQATLQEQDVAGVKLFAANRSGGGPVDVVFKKLSIRAERVTGLGTSVRTVFGKVVRGEPTAINDGALVIGAPGATGGSSPSSSSNAATSATVTNVTVARGVRAARVVAAPAGVVAGAIGAVRVVPAAPLQPAAPAQAAAASPAPTPAQGPANANAAAGELPADVFASGDAKPKTVVPLDEVEEIRFERVDAFAARFAGQPNVDVTRGAPEEGKEDAKGKEKEKDASAEPAKKAGPDEVVAPPPGTVAVKPPPKIEAKKNGVRDIQISLSGLRPNKIKQIQINCQTDKGQTSWRLEDQGQGGWPLVLRRAGTDPAAEVFLEPPPADCHQKQFTVNVQYEDGQSAAANFQADGHSDAKLAFDDQAPADPSPNVRVFLDDGGKLAGKLEGVADDVLKLATPWKATLAIPLDRIAGAYLVREEPKESPESFDDRLKARAAEDLLLARAKNGEVVPIAGVLEGVDAGRLKFTYQGKSRSLPLGQVEGVVLASRPVARDDGPTATFLLSGDAAVTGRWKAIDGADWTVEPPWGPEFKLPAAEVRLVRFQGGKTTFLSDLEPGEVEEASSLGRRRPWRRDANLAGGELKMNGVTYERGIAVHSRCVLSYDLEGRYETFEALVGFDDEARGKGRVDFRVLADGRELHADPDLRGDSPPVPIKLDLAGAARLTIVVDFGAGQDAGDRVILADARLIRGDAPAPAAAANPTEPPR